ncbi:pathogenesis-related leaf protein 4-like, partial [Andrographis paniculata]|uniref:pathogenesis-related leaf protein 4-like n=1 Tax=Andrographis paniculata TaxID=175694 RepID=UPI0021E82F2D
INSHSYTKIYTMSSNKIPLSLVFLIALITPTTIVAQNSPQDYVNSHNTARGQVGVGAVTWSTTLATYAQNYANQRIGDCNMTHSNGPYGENLAKGSSTTFSGVDAINLWVSEKSNYYYSPNSCAVGKVCGHYTQIVWRDSVRIGCGKARCNNGWYYVVCSYDPPGNWDGEWPY